MRPLHDMLKGYASNKTKQLVWSDKAKVAFHTILQSVNNCTQLYFVVDSSPIFLETDASDYGIGAYLYQMVDDKKVPIGFMSKSLSEREIGWTTIQKECYAIVFALAKFYYILRDRKFTQRTDHKKLTYVNAESEPKVNR